MTDTALHGKRFGQSLHFIQYHQSLPLYKKKSLGILQLALCRGRRQVKVKRIAAPGHFGHLNVVLPA